MGYRFIQEMFARRFFFNFEKKVTQKTNLSEPITDEPLTSHSS